MAEGPKNEAAGGQADGAAGGKPEANGGGCELARVAAGSKLTLTFGSS